MSYSLTHERIPAKPRKSAGQELKEDLTSVIIGVVIYYILTVIGKVLISPFKVLFMTDKERFEEKTRIGLEKIAAREAYRVSIPTETLREKSGTALDSRLLLAPEVYVGTGDGKRVNGEFVDYLQRQVEMHYNAPAILKHAFLVTIRKYYPEFTPDLTAIESGLALMRERAKAGVLRGELVAELIKKGISSEVASAIVKGGFTLEQVKAKIGLARNCEELDYSWLEESGSKVTEAKVALTLFCMRNGFDASENPELSRVVARTLLFAGTDTVPNAFLSGTMTAKDYNAMLNETMARGGTQEARRAFFMNSFERYMIRKIHTQRKG